MGLKMKSFFSLIIVLIFCGSTLVTGQELLLSEGTFPIYTVVRQDSNEALVVSRSDNSLYIYDLTPAVPIYTKVALDKDANGIPLKDSDGNNVLVNAPLSLAVNEVTKKAVVVNFGSDNVSIVNLEAKATEAVVPVGTAGSGPRSIAIDTRNNIAIITHVNGNVVTLLDLNTNTPVLPTPIEVGSHPISVVFDEQNEVAIVVNYGDSNVSIVKWDLSLKRGWVVNSFFIGSSPSEIVLDPILDLAVICMSGTKALGLLDTSKRPIKFKGLVPVKDNPTSIGLNTKTNMVAVLLRQSRSISLVDLKVPGKITTQPQFIGNNPQHVAVNNGNNTILVANPIDNMLQIATMGFLNYFPLVIDTGEYRTNLGIRNLGDTESTVAVSWANKDGVISDEQTVTLGPRGFNQVNNVLQFLKNMAVATNISGTLRLSSNKPFHSFVSVIDNNTNDPSLQVGMLQGSSKLLLSSSTNISPFGTRLVIMNLGNIGAAARVRARDKETGEVVGTVGTIPIEPNGFYETNDIISDLGLGNDYGSLEIDSATGQPIIAAALITSNSGTGGFLVAVPVDLPVID